MQHTTLSRICALMLALCLMAGLLTGFIPGTQLTVEAEAVSGVNSLTCADFISNTTRRAYIDTMMRTYINNNSKLATALDSGKSVVFMFEGGSDNYDSYQYVDACGSYRIQAVCIVVQKNASGNAEIVFYSENCSSIPDDANWTSGGAYDNSTTVMDGIYTMYTCNHNGKYAAFTTDATVGWYTPYSNSTGWQNYANGINIHTRAGNTCGGAAYGWANSAGCQVIGYGYENNAFNEFMKVTCGITWNSYGYTNNTFSSTYANKGYYVLDRQLGLVSPNGTEYGSGSLATLYTKGDLDAITAWSTSQRANANFGYLSQCDAYASHCQIQMTMNTEVNSLPCSIGTDDECQIVEYCAKGDTYETTGLYRNTYGNLWYEVISKSGETGYVYAGECTFVKNLDNDITLSSGATAPNGHVAGNVFMVNGTISSKYSGLTEASVYIYEGFGTDANAVTGGSAAVSGKSYTLDGSTIDYNTSFNTLTAGSYTYAISTKYTNYYATDATTLASTSGTADLMAEYFMVISAAADQSSCSHSYTSTTVKAATCTSNGTQVKSCAKCGKVITESVTKLGHAYGSWTTTKAATCTESGSRTRTCANCGHVETQTITAGHKYTSSALTETCQSHAGTRYTCDLCGDSYDVYDESLYTAWSATKPSGVASHLIQTKKQYRYADQVTTTSSSPTLSGYELIGSQWDNGTAGSVSYAPSITSTGFSTSSSLYSQYNKSKVTASETDSKKVVINSDTHTGYLYYHWCYAGSYYSLESTSGSYTTFHAYYDTTDPSTYTCDTSDMSYKTASSNCSNSQWWFVTDVYTQEYTTYSKIYTHAKWGTWSGWSDTVVTPSDTRKVEERTLYRYVDAPYTGEHNYVGGVCTLCGDKSGPVGPVDYYLIGYINGADYGCEGDYENMGQYKFVDGRLTATFTQDSYVFLKTTDNADWFMTESYVSGNSGTFYSTKNGSKEKMFVPGGVEVTFTLVENADGTLTLSYTTKAPDVTLAAKGFSLSFEDEILVNFYYTVSDTAKVTEQGMLVFYSMPDTANITAADEIYADPTYNAATGYYACTTDGISAKEMGDARYYCAYAKLSDGTCAYSPLYEYSPKKYAMSRLANSTDPNMKALCVAMLNYGAEAQLYFNYNTKNLMNKDLTTAQKALVNAYSNTLFKGSVPVTSDKIGNFAKTDTGFSGASVSVSFEGAFAINYYFKPNCPVDGNINFYYWTPADYAKTASLAPSNASGKVTMEPQSNGSYWAQVSGIPAKELDETYYVAAFYTSDNEIRCTGVIAYSLSKYCMNNAKPGNAMEALAAATAMYGYYAQTYFNSIAN